MIRYFLNVIWQLIISNPIKIVTLTVSIICFNFADTFQNGTYKEPIVTEYKDGGNYIYITRSNDESFGYEVLSYTSKQKVVDGCLVIFNYNDFNVLFWIFFGISTLFFSINTILGWITDDDDLSWNLESCQERAMNRLIYCEIEGAIIIWHLED